MFETLTNFDKKTLNKLFNDVEDLCHIDDTVNVEQKREIESYLTKLSVWIDKNNISLEKYSHKYLKAFEFIQKDLNKIDNIVAELVTPIKSETIDNWIAMHKSSDIFYSVQGNHNDKTQLVKISENAFESAFKSSPSESVVIF